jgi:hypothetical protein
MLLKYSRLGRYISKMWVDQDEKVKFRNAGVDLRNRPGKTRGYRAKYLYITVIQLSLSSMSSPFPTPYTDTDPPTDIFKTTMMRERSAACIQPHLLSNLRGGYGLYMSSTKLGHGKRGERRR